MNKSVMIVGVGGQGTLLASRILGDAMMDQGFDVKVSEVHGMSQRGGSVVTYVRYGDKVYSPVIETGEADVVLAFEQLEAARFLPYLKVGGTVVTSTQKIDPMPVVTGDKAYPQGILEEMEGKGVNVLAVDAMSSGRGGRLPESRERGAYRRHGPPPGRGQGAVALRRGALRATQIFGDEQKGFRASWNA